MKITFGGNPITLLGTTIEVGQKAPDFTVVKQDLSPFTLKDSTKRVKVISVAPSLDTSTCSLQTIRFNEEAGKLAEKVDVISVSCDLPFAQRRFCSANSIENSHVVSDYQMHDFGLKYGFLIDGLKLLTRGVVVIDGDEVKYVEYVAEASNEPDYDKALEVVKKLL